MDAPVPPTNPLENDTGKARGERLLSLVRVPFPWSISSRLSPSPFIYYHGRRATSREITRCYMTLCTASKKQGCKRINIALRYFFIVYLMRWDVGTREWGTCVIRGVQPTLKDLSHNSILSIPLYDMYSSYFTSIRTSKYISMPFEISSALVRSFY